MMRAVLALAMAIAPLGWSAPGSLSAQEAGIAASLDSTLFVGVLRALARDSSAGRSLFVLPMALSDRANVASGDSASIATMSVEQAATRRRLIYQNGFGVADALSEGTCPPRLTPIGTLDDFHRLCPVSERTLVGVGLSRAGGAYLSPVYGGSPSNGSIEPGLRAVRVVVIEVKPSGSQRLVYDYVFRLVDSVWRLEQVVLLLHYE